MVEASSSTPQIDVDQMTVEQETSTKKAAEEDAKKKTEDDAKKKADEAIINANEEAKKRAEEGLKAEMNGKGRGRNDACSWLAAFHIYTF